jgi:pre-60S factor REI1
MTKEHGLFIPDLEYVTDLEGLIKYLGEKVAVGNICLWCNGKGKAFHSIYAVQQHMEQMGHCKILYEDNEEEYEDFYDFSRDYGEGNKDEEVEFERFVTFV